MSGGVIRGSTGPGLEVLSCGLASDRENQDLPSGNTISQIRPIQPRIANPAIPFSGSTGNDVHAHGRNGISEVFSKTGQKEGHSNLHDSGPVRATVFRRGYCRGQQGTEAKKGAIGFAICRAGMGGPGSTSSGNFFEARVRQRGRSVLVFFYQTG